jgi:hexosaminidase
MLPYDIYRSVRKTLNGTAIDTKKASEGKIRLTERARKQIKGIQGQLWAETIRNFDMVEYYLFPKIYGLVERAWNIQPEWSKSYDDAPYMEAVRAYTAKITQHEIPRLSSWSVNYRIPHPGIKVVDGKLYANSPVKGAVIRYTTDGTEPTIHSPKWEGAVECNANLIKAKAFYRDKESVSTRLEVRRD